jgi:hypothetical protein
VQGSALLGCGVPRGHWATGVPMCRAWSGPKERDGKGREGGGGGWRHRLGCPCFTRVTGGWLCVVTGRQRRRPEQRLHAAAAHVGVGGPTGASAAAGHRGPPPAAVATSRAERSHQAAGARTTDAHGAVVEVRPCGGTRHGGWGLQPRGTATPLPPLWCCVRNCFPTAHAWCWPAGGLVCGRGRCCRWTCSPTARSTLSTPGACLRSMPPAHSATLCTTTGLWAPTPRCTGAVFWDVCLPVCVWAGRR